MDTEILSHTHNQVQINQFLDFSKCRGIQRIMVLSGFCMVQSDFNIRNGFNVA